MKEIAAKKAAADKILNATLVDLKFSIYNDNPHNGWFNKKKISIKGNGTNKFNLFPFLLEDKSSYKKTEARKDIWTFTTAYGVANKAGNGRMEGDTYKSFLENGFTVSINFSERLSRIVNSEFASNFSLTFIFSDGTTIEVPLQGITYGTNPKGSFTAAPGKDFILNKSFAGTEFPDPNNPVTTPVIK